MQTMGWYRITETVQSGWECTTGNPLVFFHTAQQNSEKWFGNKEVEKKTKTFELTYEGAQPDNTTFWVTYYVDGVKADPLQLTGTSNPLTGSVELPKDSVITDVLWYAMWDPAGAVGAQKIPLGQTETGDGEVLDEDKTNTFTYGGEIKGHKYNDLNRDGNKDRGEPGLGLWQINLERKVGNDWLPYASQLTRATGDIGFYRFYSVLPGEYRVSETLKDGWVQTKPERPRMATTTARSIRSVPSRSSVSARAVSRTSSTTRRRTRRRPSSSRMKGRDPRTRRSGSPTSWTA